MENSVFRIFDFYEFELPLGKKPFVDGKGFDVSMFFRIVVSYIVFRIVMFYQGSIST